MKWLVAFVFLLAISGGAVQAQEVRAVVSEDAWTQYKARFLDPSGRIVDDGNDNISHSEGQGYGLLLAFLADNPADFEQIWSFTRRELLLRDDGLAAWKWSPVDTPHVVDINNATDGDILIAYALALAGERWGRSDYLSTASAMAKAILDNAVVEYGGRTLLTPGVSGFSASDRADGPVINPSYWIFEAFPVLNRVAPSPKWQTLSEEGEAMIEGLQFGPRKMPADWVSARTMLKPAAGFPAHFGYNALRIPLYLARAGYTDRELLSRLADGMGTPDGAIAIIDLDGGTVIKALDDPGYRIVNHILACVLDGAKLPDTARLFSPTQYYPSTLHLLGLSFVEQNHPECL
ncbi:glycosyl hydrolase family 8 [Sinorhizobium chiapasense]|uniref:cellulase n=1 Tax=Sinorhizobium chiapasense TaxID=501572 RepID=A0ABZ2BN15_9HYPH